jgi:acetylornithine deacetylase/succinyl-diaminopimelate desuccinylase-like protein
MLPSGGSIPIVETFASKLSVPTALMGFALPTDCLHAPNERFSLRRFGKAIEASIRLMEHFGSTGASTCR